jgi:ArsR family transcriptional regulator, arsenate/arsenite/antimonite-responsive transcriptional repressor
LDKLTDFFKLLSDETRLRILVLLYHKELCVCEMCGIMEESQPKISKHLAKLRDMGLVKDERKEQFIIYYLKADNELFKEVIEKIVENIESYPVLKNDIERSRDAEKYLETCKSKRVNSVK